MKDQMPKGSAVLHQHFGVYHTHETIGAGQHTHDNSETLAHVAVSPIATTAGEIVVLQERVEKLEAAKDDEYNALACPTGQKCLGEADLAYRVLDGQELGEAWGHDRIVAMELADRLRRLGVASEMLWEVARAAAAPGEGEG